MEKHIEVIGIDHGWSNMKTATQIFTTGVKEITTEPAFYDDVVELDGKYYKVGGKRLEVRDTKVENDNFYLLTLAAIAKELNRRGMRNADVLLSVGLPLTRFGAEKQDFIDYLSKKKEIGFRFEKEKYTARIARVSVFPQCYAAVAEQLRTLPGRVVVVDIGSWTIDIMCRACRACIPCPSELYRSRGDTRLWKNKGRKCYWTACKVENIIRDEKYTGTMVQLKTKLDAVGGKQVSRPKEEWVRVENTHEPVITYPQYIRAVSSLKQQKAKESKKMKNIYYCGCCGRALFNAHYGTIFCKQRSFKTGSDCSDIEINKHEADMAVLASVRKEAEIFLDRDKLSRQVIKRNSPLSVSDRINSTMRSIEAAQKSWIALYDKYADGKLEREFFLNEKKQYDADMEKLEEELAALRQAQEEEESEQEGSQRKADQAMAFLEEEELTEDMKEKLIEKVVVYPGNRIAIAWKFEGHLNN